MALPRKIARPPRGDNEQDRTQWLEEVERIINLLLAAFWAGTAWGPITNVATDRAYDASATTTAELANVLGTLVADMKAKGMLQ